MSKVTGVKGGEITLKASEMAGHGGKKRPALGGKGCF